MHSSAFETRRTPHLRDGTRRWKLGPGMMSREPFGKPLPPPRHDAPVGRCGRRTARRATHPRTASQAGDALIDQTSGLADHYEEERCHELISVLLSPVSRTASRHAAICMPFFHHTSLAHTSHHAQPRAIASASHARASGMHTPTRQPHTPCGPSVCVCPASCVRLCVMSTSYLPPHGVTPPPGVKTSGRSKKPLRL